MIPKFANPHRRAHDTHIVSRHDLLAEASEERAESIQDEDALSTLDVLVKRSLGEFQVQSGDGSARGSERASKRRKTVVTEAERGRGSDGSDEPVDSIRARSH